MCPSLIGVRLFLLPQTALVGSCNLAGTEVRVVLLADFQVESTEKQENHERNSIPYFLDEERHTRVHPVLKQALLEGDIELAACYWLALRYSFSCCAAGRRFQMPQR